MIGVNTVGKAVVVRTINRYEAGCTGAVDRDRRQEIVTFEFPAFRRRRVLRLEISDRMQPGNA